MWSIDEEAVSLAERFKSVQNREQFARDHKVPGKGAMIYQHIHGLKPISLDAAMAYARGFKVSLEAISPRLAAEVKRAGQQIGDNRIDQPTALYVVEQPPDLKPDPEKSRILEGFSKANRRDRELMLIIADRAIADFMKRSETN